MRRKVAVAAVTVALAAGPAGAADFDVEAVAESCAACHGADGLPVEPEVPIIWGQQFYYLYVQLRDYASGLRAHETMSGIASAFEREEMQALAQHFAEKEWPNIGAEPADAAVAKGAEAAGQCTQCHGTYRGDSSVPRLAGQTEAYLARTMLDFKNRERQNSPEMGLLMRSFGDDQIEALARYLAAL